MAKDVLPVEIVLHHILHLLILFFFLFTEVYSVYPTSGSLVGGTLLTITGQYFDDTDADPIVYVGGKISIQIKLNKKRNCMHVWLILD